MYISLLSTQELVNWMKKNQFLFEDKSVNFIFVTNMSRNENGKFNELAGIEGLR